MVLDWRTGMLPAGKQIVQANPVNFQLFTELEKCIDETARQFGIGEGNTSGIEYALGKSKVL